MGHPVPGAGDTARRDMHAEHGHDENLAPAEHGAHANHGGHEQQRESPGAPHGEHAAAPQHAGPAHGRHAGHSVADFKRRFLISLAITVPVILTSPGLPFVDGGRLVTVPNAEALLLGLSSVLYGYGGWPFLKGLVREVRDRAPGMMTLVAVAITVAYAYSAATVLGLEGMPFFWELATLVDIMLLGHWIEMRSVGEASKALESLARLMPSQAHRREGDGSTRDVPIDELRAGDEVVIKPGERVPADGDVIDGASGVDESMLTGESVPISKHPGDSVIGGSVNGEGALVVRVSRTGEESFLAQVIELVRQAQASKSRTQDLADRAATWLTAVALFGGAATFAAWMAAGRELAFSMERAVTVMVIACPHALGLAIPLVVAVSTAYGAASGLLVKDRMAFENARLIDTIVFDKTGTLTLGRFGVDSVATFGGHTREQVLGLAAAVERLSEHPIAKAIAAESPETAPATEFLSIPGKGAQGTVDGREIAVVSPGYLKAQGIAAPPDANVESADGRTLVYVVSDRTPVGAIALSDQIRPESVSAIRRIKAMGIEPVMLTGDNAVVAKRVAAELGIERFFAEILPAEKASSIGALHAEGRSVAMVGDGVNDAPALAAADLGIAIGAGTDVAVATADVVLVDSDLDDVVTIIALARATYRKMIQNLIWATGYNVIAIPLAAGVLAGYGIILSPALGGLLMSASTVIVAVNARLLSVPGMKSDQILRSRPA